jgi:CRISPR-associated endonuclease/helicase Cas3
MAGGLFVFDEIHCYEPQAVALIIGSAKQIKAMDGKFIFMSATLPQFITNLLASIVPRDRLIQLDPIDAMESKILNRRRYRLIKESGDIVDNLDQVKNVLDGHTKVLVVCNTVSRAQEIYRELKSSARRPILIHSRFITRNRERIERDIPESDLLVGTQAIEVSLNIDFDTIFTEPAPADALFQRLGRVNRFMRHKIPVPAYVFRKGSEADEYVYDQDRVKKTLDLLPDDQTISDGEAANIVEELYAEGYNKREREQYQEALEDFNAIIQQLPLFDEGEFKEEFFDLIKSAEVVPRKFKEEYFKLRSEKRFIDCVGLLLPISIHQYHRLISEERIHREDGVIFADARYSEEYGLELAEREDYGTTVI